MQIQSFLNSRGVDIFALTDNHIVFSARNCNKLLLVPGADIAGVHPALVEFFFCSLLVVCVAVGGFCRALNNNLALGFVVSRNNLVGFCFSVVVNLYNSNLVVSAGAARAS